MPAEQERLSVCLVVFVREMSILIDAVRCCFLYDVCKSVCFSACQTHAGEDIVNAKWYQQPAINNLYSEMIFYIFNTALQTVCFSTSFRVNFVFCIDFGHCVNIPPAEIHHILCLGFSV